MLPAGVLFLVLIPSFLAWSGDLLDSWLGLPAVPRTLPFLVLGSGLLLAGLGFALWSIVSQLTQGRGTPLPMMATQQLLVSGPFQYCRNPMTLGTLLLYLGYGILIGSIAAICLVVALFLGLVAYILRIEERELEQRFGEEYLAYKRRTPFIIPRVRPRAILPEDPTAGGT